MTKIAGRDIGAPDLLLLATGVVGVVNLFLPWYRLGTDEDLSTSEGRRALEFFGLPDDLTADHLSANAFGAGLLAIVAGLLIITVAGLVAVKVWAGVTGPAPLPALLSGLALLVLLLKLLADHEWVSVGLLVALALAAGQLALSLVTARGAGTSSPAPASGNSERAPVEGPVHDGDQ